MKKGFTLIELLAVIVILAIIGLVATPIVLNIIDDAKIESSERSNEMFKKAVQNAIAQYQLNHPNEKVVGTFYVDEKNPYKFKSSDGSIELTLEFDGKIQNLFSKFKVDVDGSIDLIETICRGVKEATTGNIPKKDKYVAGDEYICTVKENTPYRFFVLNSNEDTVNLIMYANINSDGIPVDSNSITNKGLTYWNENGDITQGPVTANAYLQEATKDWRYLEKISEKYSDKGDWSYSNFNIEGYARLPKESELAPHCNPQKWSCDYWLVDNLYYDTEEHAQDEYLANLPNYSGYSSNYIKNSVNNIYGYWALDTTNQGFGVATGVSSYGYLSWYDLVYNSNFIVNSYNNQQHGVRPVIRVSIDNMVQ